MKTKRYIAGQTTTNPIRNICSHENPERVLEFGGGSGALSYEVLKNSDAYIDIYEPLPKFQEILRKKLIEFEGRFTIYTSYLQLSPHRKYNLFIIDGGKNKNELAFHKTVACHLLSLDSVNKIVIEGQRKSQRYWVAEILKIAYIYKPKIHTDISGGKVGALELTCKKSNNRLFKLLNHLFYRRRIYK